MNTSPSRFAIIAADLTTDPDLLPVLPGQEMIVAKSPTFSTDIAMASSGRERRRRLWSYPIWQLSLSYDVIRSRRATLPEMQKLYAFFCSHAGKYQEFFVYDRTDDPVSGQTIGVGDGTSTAFQLMRTIGSAGQVFTEPVRGTLGQPTVLVNGQAPGAYTVQSYGLLVFTNPPAQGSVVSWSGTPLYCCRFDMDQIDPAQMTKDLWSLSSLKVRTIKR